MKFVPKKKKKKIIKWSELFYVLTADLLISGEGIYLERKIAEQK